MPAFSADFTDGTTVSEWLDPATVSVPSRINPFAEHPHLRHEGQVGVEVEVSGRVDGVTGPLDVDLDDANLFKLSFVELPGYPPPSKSSPVGQSSVQRFTPLISGHYAVMLRRLEHGQVILHLDVQP